MSQPAPFQGFPVAALDFYDDLEVDNTKSFWEAHKAVYTEAVKAPMAALTDALADEFGAAKVFRPYRDVRFAKDKTPYKTHQGAYVPVAAATGWYVEVSARGVRTGAGFYEASSAALAAVRQSIDDERTGTELERIVAGLETEGWSIGGETLNHQEVLDAGSGLAGFGPTTALIRTNDIDEAIRAANSVEFGLSSSIFTRDVNKAFRAMRDLNTGITYINAGTTGAEVHLPFGGTKATGNGHREAGQAALDFYTEWKSIYVDYSGKLQRAQIDTFEDPAP